MQIKYKNIQWENVTSTEEEVYAFDREVVNEGIPVVAFVWIVRAALLTNPKRNPLRFLHHSSIKKSNLGKCKLFFMVIISHSLVDGANKKKEETQPNALKSHLLQRSLGGHPLPALLSSAKAFPEV